MNRSAWHFDNDTMEAYTVHNIITSSTSSPFVVCTLRMIESHDFLWQWTVCSSSIGIFIIIVIIIIILPQADYGRNSSSMTRYQYKPRVSVSVSECYFSKETVRTFISLYSNQTHFCFFPLLFSSSIEALAKSVFTNITDPKN